MPLLSTEDRLTDAESGLLVVGARMLLAMRDYFERGEFDYSNWIGDLLPLDERTVARVKEHFLCGEGIDDLMSIERTISTLQDYLAQGRFNEAIHLVQSVVPYFVDAAIRVYAISAREAARFIREELGVDFWFDLVDPETVSELQQMRDELIAYFRGELTAAAALALSAAGLANLSVDETADRLRLSFGLTERQQRAVENYRRLLERTVEGDTEALTRRLRDPQFDDAVRAAARDRTPLTREQIDRMVAAYAERQLAYRAKVTAAVESLRAVHAGTEAALRQAVGSGLLTADQVRREWRNPMDGKERTSHHLLHGLKRALGETFPGLAGPIRFPGDPRADRSEVANCRCWLRYDLIPLDQVLAA